MNSFKKTNVKVFPKTGKEATKDNAYWKRFQEPVILKEFGAINHVDVSPVDPHYFAVSSSAKVQVYHPITRLVHKNLNRFHKAAYGATFRSDGRLLCAGGEEGVLRLFDVATKSLLRVFKGHTRAVHRVCFTPDGTRICSFSDDRTISLWDVPTEKTLVTLEGHEDYVRSGLVWPGSPDVLVSGSYDHTVRMWDTRVANTSTKAVLEIKHDFPVEDVLSFPTPGLLVSCSGNDVIISDTVSAGRRVATVAQHHKTVTCLQLASEGKRLLSGSLDRKIKVHDISQYRTVHTLDFPSSILCLAAAPDDQFIIAGMADGLVAISRRGRSEDGENKVVSRKAREKVNFLHRVHADFKPRIGDIEIQDPDLLRKHLSKFDKKLAKFQYSEALKEVLRGFYTTSRPGVSVVIIQELIRRDGLKAALAGKDGKELKDLFEFVCRQLKNPMYMKTMAVVAKELIHIYMPYRSENHQIRLSLKKLKQSVDHELAFQEESMKIQGMLGLILGSASRSRSQAPRVASGMDNLEPSESARGNFVVSVP